MAIQNYSVDYRITASPFWAALTNVQGFTVNMGRRAQLDQYNTNTATIELRYPTGYANPIAELVSGTTVRITNSTTSTVIYTGFINDIAFKYGIPYASGVGVADYVSISLEGAFAKLGRMQGQGYAMAAGTLETQCNTAATQTGVPIVPMTNVASTQMAATTVNNTWGDWVNQSVLTLNGRMVDSVGIQILNKYPGTIETINFSDTTNNATNQVYDDIQFESLADNYYTQVTVAPESFSSATVTKAGATTPYRTYRVNTLSASTAQATDFANYLLSTYGIPQSTLSTISATAEQQAVFKLDQFGPPAVSGSGLEYCVGTQTNIAFRGSTYTVIIEGATVSATPTGSRYTYYVSGADLNNYLTLDSTVFGRLDYNKLGY